MYKTIQDLPFVCQLNLPESALHVYRDAFNEAWSEAADDQHRFATAQNQAWAAVRTHFRRDRQSSLWVARPVAVEPRVSSRYSTRPALQEQALSY
jgi:cation transport regulator ChaB